MNPSIQKYYELLTAKAIESMKERGMEAYLTYSREEALQKLLEIIPEGANVMTGGSTTLEEIGFIDVLNGSRYNYLKKEVLQENDDERRRTLRRKALTADYFIGSANAIASSGEIVCIDHGGGRISAYAYAAKRVILVTGVNKLTWTLDEALARARNYAGPLEAIRTNEPFPFGSIGKTLIIEKEAFLGRIKVIFVMDILGF